MTGVADTRGVLGGYSGGIQGVFRGYPGGIQGVFMGYCE